MSSFDHRVFGKEIGLLIKETIERALDARLAPILERLTLIEQKESPLQYRGVFKHGERYPQGSFATHGGSVWYAQTETTNVPGDGPDWVLAVRRGRDGKDGRDRDRGVLA